MHPDPPDEVEPSRPADSDELQDTFPPEDNDKCFGAFQRAMQRERHDDHVDRVFFWNHWSPMWIPDDDNWEHTWVWNRDMCKWGKHSHSNAQLHQAAGMDDFLNGLAAGQRDGVWPLLSKWRMKHRALPYIPLMENGDGDEYQINSFIKPGEWLPQILCPVLLNNTLKNCWEGTHFLLKARLGSSNNPVPFANYRLVLGLGLLYVRTKARAEIHEHGREPFTEVTDYDVFVDLEDADMPLWIVAARENLQDRFDGESNVPEGTANVPALPIFGGHMRGDGGYYHAACFLPSIRRLASSGGDEQGEPLFQEACELVRRTRANIDPGLYAVNKQQVKDILERETSSCDTSGGAGVIGVAEASDAPPGLTLWGHLWSIASYFWPF